MNWFQRHLNWSLFLGIFVFPFIIVILLIVLGGLIGGAGKLSGTVLVVLSIIIELVILAIFFGTTWWYLGQKARSKWYLLLILVPWGLSNIGALMSKYYTGVPSGNIFGEILKWLAGLTGLGGYIWLFLLQNHAFGYASGYDADFINELQADRWQDTGPFSAPDDRQFKELDYTPAKNVLDMVGGGDAKDSVGMRDVGTAGTAGEEAPVPEKVTERSVTAERLKMPILLDDAGAVIRCFYHPGADAVNLCSRCKQYVCNECNYVTGTHPICRNCWEKRAEVPMAPPAQKQASPPSVKPGKQEVVVPTQPAEQKDLGPMKPEQQKDMEPVKPEKQKIVAPAKSAKLDAEKSEWLPEFMALYRQAIPIVNMVTSKSADAMPASPLDLMEGLKLRPMLERAKKLSKPKDKELREARSEFEQVLSGCIKIADAAADFVSGGGQALLGGPDFARIVNGIETANGLIEKLSRRLASFPHVQE